MTDNDIITRVIQEEGSAYSNDPADHGGPSKFGITIPDLVGTHFAHTADAIRNLTEDDARAIYQSIYITGPKYDLIDDPVLRAQVVDCAVLHGVENATRMLQRVVDVQVDGELGPITAAAVNTPRAPLTAAKIALELTKSRISLIGSIVSHSPSQAKFLSGWLDRAMSFL